MAQQIPGPFAQELLDDLPYDPEVLLFDRLLEVDLEAGRVRCRWPTRADAPITRSQRNHPVRHPPHVAGTLMVHATGILGFIHGYHVLGLRHADGWIGYGTNMYKAAFRKLVPPGGIIDASCWTKRARIGKTRHFVRYGFEFLHEKEICYQSEQAAMWLCVGEDAAAKVPTL